ncbi:MAG: hypothetical protein QM489_00630 [Candidatus Izemoplasma sp.]
MIIVDYSNVLIKAVFTQGVETDKIENLRALILSQFKSLKMKFSSDYGRFVVALDGQKNWRKKTFEHYKYRRKIGRAESPLDWGAIFAMSSEIIEEFRQYLPYQFLKVNICEADDIIGYMAANSTEKTLVCSSDKDFIQLLQFPHVDWYSLHHKKLMTCEDPLVWLEEQIIRGQKKDDIPNILSAEDHFVNSPDKRQKVISAKFLAQCLTSEPEKFCPDKETLDRYNMNRILLDLTAQPEHVITAIQEAIEEPYLQNNHKIYKFFSLKKLKLFMRSNLSAFCEDFT